MNLKALVSKYKANLKEIPIKTLEEAIIQADMEYHKHGKPSLTDTQYDLLKETLEHVKPNSKALKNVGFESGAKTKTKLPEYMSSLDKRKPSDVEGWIDDDEYYMLADKLDGISLLLDYVSATQVKVYTRGDGSIGGEVSFLAPYLKIPKPSAKLKGYRVRAEALMPRASFDQIKHLGKTARNLVSGLFDRNQPAIKTLQRVDVVAYRIFKPMMKVSEQFKTLKSLGFKVAPNKRIKGSVLSAQYLSNHLASRKADSHYEIDGIVLSKDTTYRNEKGENPEWAVAFKENTEVFEVKVIGVEWKASRHAYLKPRVNVEPVQIGGVTINFATGFNAFFIVNGHRPNEKRPKRPIGPGAIVRIMRSGDVIPHIEEVVKGVKKPALPDVDFEWNESGIDIVQTDAHEDDGIQVELLTNFVVKIGVENIKAASVSSLYEAGYDDPVKLSKITLKQAQEVLGQAKGKQLYEGMREALSDVYLPDLMVASNCFGRIIGITRCEAVYEAIPDIMDLSPAEVREQMEELKGWSEKTIDQFMLGLKNFKALVKKMKVTIAEPEEDDGPEGDALEGEVVVFTGFRDAELEEEIENQSGVVGGSVSGKTTILLIKDKSFTSAKVDAARAKGIKILTAAEFRKKYGV